MSSNGRPARGTRCRRGREAGDLGGERAVITAGKAMGMHVGPLPEICGTPGGMKLEDLSPLMARRRAGGLSYGYDRFRADPAVAPLQWPDDVLEQFLYDFGDNPAFVDDYGSIDLREIRWRLEMIPAADFHGIPTGAFDAGCIEEFAKNPVYWVTVRPSEVGRYWEEHGTWLRPPVLIDRCLLAPSDSGLQVVEGRTCVGVLRGRLREGLNVASHHQAWVGRS
ncbi:hypothetical protein AB0M38_34855 [Streptomyces sp. NPDC051742]|uniref:hypothetical protein n=1 Tax=unclassified Streptomyces TaxID=2593676 RepID=UPI0034134096